MTGAVIVAAGKGSRMRINHSKQYINIKGIPVLARTLGVFEFCSSIDVVALVVCADDIDFCKKEIVEKFGIMKVFTIIPGGITRQQSVSLGIDMLKSVNTDIVVIHDGARPLVTCELIERCIEACREEVDNGGHGSVCAAVPLKDTVRICEDTSTAAIPIYSQKTLNRNVLWGIQTPQVFDMEIISEAHKRAAEEGFEGTDDNVLTERLGVKTRLVMGDYLNIKLTTIEDLDFIEHITTIHDNGIKSKRGEMDD